MAYQTYITEAIVCGSIDSNTSNRSYYLFTREAGMVFAHAQSVREERSKHRYSLQVCSYARVTLVRGKSGWRITGAEPIQNFYTHAESRSARALARAVPLLLTRFVHGETAHPVIFDDVIYACMQSNTEDPAHLESILTLRVLYVLGYIAPDSIVTPFVSNAFQEAIRLTLDARIEKHIKQMILHAHTESHL